MSYLKFETFFIDRIEFRVVCHDELWGSWYVDGDSFLTSSTDDVTMTSPFFTTTIKGGWLQPIEYHITTSRGVDPALSMLLSHVCINEFSIENIKSLIDWNSPNHPPYDAELINIHCTQTSPITVPYGKPITTSHFATPNPSFGSILNRNHSFDSIDTKFLTSHSFDSVESGMSSSLQLNPFIVDGLTSH